MKAAADYLDGAALPGAEREAARRNGLRLAADLAEFGKLSVTHDLGWLNATYERLGWNVARSLRALWWPHDSTPQRSLIVALTRPDGQGGEDLIGAAAARWIWLHGTLREAHESGQFFYGDYAGVAADAVRVRVGASMADQIGYCGVAYSCGLHVAKGTDDRISWRLVRLVHLLAAMNWHFSYLIGRSEPAIARRWNESAWGLAFAENGIYVTRPDGSRETAYHLVGARQDQLRRQLARPEYGDGAASLSDHLPLLQAMAVHHG